MRQLILGLGLLAVFGLVGCSGGGGNDAIGANEEQSPSSPVQAEGGVEMSPQITTEVDGAYSELEVTDQKGNTYSVSVPAEYTDKVVIKEGVAGAIPAGFELVSNEYIEVNVDESSDDQRLAITLGAKNSVTMIYQYIESEDILKEVPFISRDNLIYLRLQTDESLARFIVIGEQE